MKQFNLDEYLANPSKKVITRRGLNARIICTDRKDLIYTIVALIETKSGGESIQFYTKVCGRRILISRYEYETGTSEDKHDFWRKIKGYFTKGGNHASDKILKEREEKD